VFVSVIPYLSHLREVDYLSSLDRLLYTKDVLFLVGLMTDEKIFLVHSDDLI